MTASPTPQNRQNAFGWGLIGYGDLADKRVAAALQQSGELRAVWGRQPERTVEFAQRHGIPQACASLEEMLSMDLDAIYVCTPPASHADYAVAAAEHGKHVLIEKPMAASQADCERIQRAVAAHQVTAGVAYYRRAFPKMQRVRDLIAAGAIGTPTWVNIAAHSWFAPDAQDPKHWRVEKAASGGAGALADIGVHRLDLLEFWLPGAQVVGSRFRNLVHSYEVEDSSSLLLELPNGAPVHAYFAWNSQTWIDRFEIVGSAGKLIMEPLDGPGLTVIRGRDREDLSLPPPENAHLPCVEDFVEACQTGRAPLCDAAAGAAVNALLEDAIRRAQQA